MKKLCNLFIYLILTIGFLPLTYSQLNNIDFLKGGIGDAELLFQEYLNPYANIFGANLNAGWYNTAKPHKLGGFDVTITINAAWAPSADRMFNMDDLSLSTDAGFTGGTESPTIAGKKTDQRPEIFYSKNIPNIGDVEYARYKLPDGSGISFLPLPMLQAGIGLPFGTDVTVRFFPNMDLGKSGNIGLWGVGLKHSLIQHIPGLKELPILDISAQFGYTKLSTYSNINYDPMDIVEDVNHDYINDMNVWLDQKLKLGATSWTVNLVISQTLPIISFYQSIGYSNSKVNFGLSGNFPFPSVETNTASPYFGEVVVKDVQGEGIIKDPINMEMKNSKDLRLNAGMRIKLGVLTIHFDYTKANYSVLTAGLGVSFR